MPLQCRHRARIAVSRLCHRHRAFTDRRPCRRGRRVDAAEAANRQLDHRHADAEPLTWGFAARSGCRVGGARRCQRLSQVRQPPLTSATWPDRIGRSARRWRRVSQAAQQPLPCRSPVGAACQRPPAGQTVHVIRTHTASSVCEPGWSTDAGRCLRNAAPLVSPSVTVTLSLLADTDRDMFCSTTSARSDQHQRNAVAVDRPPSQRSELAGKER
jgi:hypothetical protein